MTVSLTRLELRSVIVDVLRKAGELLKNLKGGERIDHEGGAFGDSVNDTELHADKILGEFIGGCLKERLHGAIGHISVEGQPEMEIAGGSLLVTVDPLDGSLNYKTRGKSIGLPYSACITVFNKMVDTRFRDVIAAGVIDLRCGDLWYSGQSVHDDERYLTSLNDFEVHTMRAETLDLGRMVVIGEMYYPMNRELLTRAFAGQKGWLRNPGSAAYEMALVASGQAAAYICDRQKNHELGAAYALLMGADGIAIDLEGNDLGSHDYVFSAQTPVILACNRKIADEILALVWRAR
jgi:fructose-1,6-bisphosphatase/inositol monophosphatase family enzyme